MCVELVRQEPIPLVGGLALPFIDQGGAWVTDGRKKKNQRPRSPFEGVGLSFNAEPALLTRCQGLARLPGARVLATPCPYRISKWPRPVLPLQAACQTRVLACGPVGSGQHGDNTSVTVDGASLFLDRSCCRMSVLVSAPEG